MKSYLIVETLISLSEVIGQNLQTTKQPMTEKPKDTFAFHDDATRCCRRTPLDVRIYMKYTIEN